MRPNKLCEWYFALSQTPHSGASVCVWSSTSHHSQRACMLLKQKTSSLWYPFFPVIHHVCVCHEIALGTSGSQISHFSHMILDYSVAFCAIHASINAKNAQRAFSAYVWKRICVWMCVHTGSEYQATKCRIVRTRRMKGRNALIIVSGGVIDTLTEHLPHNYGKSDCGSVCLGVCMCEDFFNIQK